MATARNSGILRAIPLLITIYLFSLPSYAKYGSGTGEPNNPYQIATAEDLILLGDSPEDYDKHFILTANIDLDPNLPGRKVFDRAVIAPDTNDVEFGFQGTHFNGVFDGNGHTISHLMITGENSFGMFGHLGEGAKISNLGLIDPNIDARRGYDVGSLVGHNSGTITNCYVEGGTISGFWDVGGLAGYNNGSIATSYSTGTVSGEGDIGGLVGKNYGSVLSSYSTVIVTGDRNIGGLVGNNNLGGSISNSYSTAKVSGTEAVGGLVGPNFGSVANSYSTGKVSGSRRVGGLVAGGHEEGVSNCFWDMQTSTVRKSNGGTGLTTEEMRNTETFLRAGWDFVDESPNGTCDYWQTSPGDYPRLSYHTSQSLAMPDGLGTAEQPYLIRDERDLGTVWFEPLAHYRLEASIDLSEITWSMAVIPWFEGTFDGNNLVISNLHIQGSGYLGLFGQLGSGAKIINLGLEVVDVNGTSDSIGSFAGGNKGFITSCYSTGEVSGDEYIGGLGVCPSNS